MIKEEVLYKRIDENESSENRPTIFGILLFLLQKLGDQQRSEYTIIQNHPIHFPFPASCYFKK